ncbi:MULTISPECIES: DUF956 family protein [Leuconostoc]|uniref:Regulator of the mannose operon, ManO n=2 Tax=Leuconostoc kimchii TaxID=136609 RepID=D5T470_LEUKI|nr:MULTISPECIES: DUF956 family protein [Leuconostoc]ADG41008.1 hypothetical protein LKI_07345 [Leuconostoc kimchii IMSNU 11154]AEJ31020.1 hypothetical protein LGMK_04810 [Leuconostoc sp. C2]QBR48115.1 DUF956 family protein [Leuconostoc kimchii]
MVQSLNSSVALTTQGISFLGIGAQYGKFLLGDKAFEFFNDNNVDDFIQIPWQSMTAVYADVSAKKIGRRFRIETDKGSFNFSSSETGRLLKVTREHIGDDKVLKNPTLLKRIKGVFKKKDKKGAR